MIWIEPKTNWSGDNFDVEVDYERIRGNIEYVNYLCNKFYGDCDLINMPDYKYEDVPTEIFFNTQPQNLERIVTTTYRPLSFQIMRGYVSGGTPYNSNDLNIIESNTLLLYNVLNSYENNKRKLAFKLGKRGIF